MKNGIDKFCEIMKKILYKLINIEHKKILPITVKKFKL